MATALGTNNTYSSYLDNAPSYSNYISGDGTRYMNWRREQELQQLRENHQQQLAQQQQQMEQDYLQQQQIQQQQRHSIANAVKQQQQAAATVNPYIEELKSYTFKTEEGKKTWDQLTPEQQDKAVVKLARSRGDVETGVSGAFKSSVDQMVGGLQTTAAEVARRLKQEKAAQYLDDLAEENFRHSNRYFPTVPSYKDINTTDDLFNYLAENVAGAIPYAPMTLSGPKGWAMAMTAAASNTGITVYHQTRLKQKVDWMKAGTAGTTNVLLERLPGAALGKILASMAKKKRLLRSGAVVANEAGQTVAQTMVDNAALGQELLLGADEALAAGGLSSGTARLVGVGLGRAKEFATNEKKTTDALKIRKENREQDLVNNKIRNEQQYILRQIYDDFKGLQGMSKADAMKRVKEILDTKPAREKTQYANVFKALVKRGMFSKTNAMGSKGLVDAKTLKSYEDSATKQAIKSLDRTKESNVLGAISLIDEYGGVLDTDKLDKPVEVGSKTKVKDILGMDAASYYTTKMGELASEYSPFVKDTDKINAEAIDNMTVDLKDNINKSIKTLEGKLNKALKNNDKKQSKLFRDSIAALKEFYDRTDEYIAKGKESIPPKLFQEVMIATSLLQKQGGQTTPSIISQSREIRKAKEILEPSKGSSKTNKTTGAIVSGATAIATGGLSIPVQAAIGLTGQATLKAKQRGTRQAFEKERIKSSLKIAKDRLNKTENKVITAKTVAERKKAMEAFKKAYIALKELEEKLLIEGRIGTIQTPANTEEDVVEALTVPATVTAVVEPDTTATPVKRQKQVKGNDTVPSRVGILLNQ